MPWLNSGTLTHPFQHSQGTPSCAPHLSLTHTSEQRNITRWRVQSNPDAYHILSCWQLNCRQIQAVIAYRLRGLGGPPLVEERKVVQ